MRMWPTRSIRTTGAAHDPAATEAARREDPHPQNRRNHKAEVARLKVEARPLAVLVAREANALRRSNRRGKDYQPSARPMATMRSIAALRMTTASMALSSGVHFLICSGVVRFSFRS